MELSYKDKYNGISITKLMYLRHYSFSSAASRSGL